MRRNECDLIVLQVVENKDPDPHTGARQTVYFGEVYRAFLLNRPILSRMAGLPGGSTSNPITIRS